VTALDMSAICPDDTVLRIDAAEGALLFADSVIHYGELGFVSDGLIGDDPETVQEQTRELAGRLLEQRFDHLLFAHGTPLVGRGKDALRAFAAGG
jgi:glyoxylase-like metal-dependent hydrolase (beta-lactamase superfamily II)